MTERKRDLGSDMAKADAYVNTKRDYDEIPELTDKDFARGVWHIGGKPVPRGRPKSKAPKHAVSLRLDADVLAHYRRTGRGWQSRINAALRRVAKLPKEKRKKA
ncbi:MAG TPA: BrnA antitoxin family protein [Pseudolabrys sp.]|nr:BrnA antitoxin family protein [Pseudolabrys sp.]